MKKETFTDKLIKRFYGIAGPLDEYKRREVDRIGNICFVYLSYALLFGNMIAIFLADRFAEQVAWVYPIVLAAIIFIAFGYVMAKSKSARISEFEEEELTPKEQKNFRHAGVKTGLVFGLGMHIFQGILQYMSAGTPLFDTWLNPISILINAISGVFFGLAMHFIIKSRKSKGDK